MSTMQLHLSLSVFCFGNFEESQATFPQLPVCMVKQKSSFTFLENTKIRLDDKYHCLICILNLKLT